MNIINNPDWINLFKYPYDSFEQIPDSVFNKINTDIDKIQSHDPLVTIIIAAWNEEVNILRCIASLSKMKTSFPFEILVVNNNSQDKTHLTLEKLRVRKLFQPLQGCGPARQLGQENANGKYILLADADCIYPNCWLTKMIQVLKEKDVVCVYGRYSFLSDKGFPRWKLFILERFKDIIAELRQFKRPYLNAYGISMGYIKDYGLKVGYVMKNIRGEDGRLCFDLMQFGKVKQVRSNNARPWTGARTLKKDGSFRKVLISRIIIELGRLKSMFTTHQPHDTKTSTNG